MSAAGFTVRVARRLPVGWLRATNRWLYGTASRRRLLAALWIAVADEQSVIVRGPLAGWMFASGGGQPGYLLGASEPDLQAVLVDRVHPGDVVYDVGANVGYFTLLAARLATPAGHVYAFEPIVANIRSLRRNLELNDVRHATVVESAVGDDCAPVRMSLGATNADSHLAEDGPQLVPSTTVDVFVCAGHRPPTLVKIDVEGAENLVLKGMRDTLSAHRPVVVCEVHYERSDPRRDAIQTLFRELQYDVRLLAHDAGSMPHLLALPRD